MNRIEAVAAYKATRRDIILLSLSTPVEVNGIVRDQINVRGLDVADPVVWADVAFDMFCRFSDVAETVKAKLPAPPRPLIEDPEEDGNIAEAQMAAEQAGDVLAGVVDIFNLPTPAARAVA